MAKAVHPNIPALWMHVLTAHNLTTSYCSEEASLLGMKCLLQMASTRAPTVAFFMLITLLNVHWSAVTVVQLKERSTYWREQIVNCTFTPNDWLKNFWMSHYTFMHLCNEFWQAVEKEDTVMCKGISVESQLSKELPLLCGGWQQQQTSADGRCFWINGLKLRAWPFF